MAGIQTRGRGRTTTNKIEQIKTQNKVVVSQSGQSTIKYKPIPASGQLDQSTQNQIQPTASNIEQSQIVKKAKTRRVVVSQSGKSIIKYKPKQINTQGLTPLGKFGLGIYNTGSDYANILNTGYEDKSVLNQAIGHAFEGNWDKAGQVIQNNPYRFAGNLAVEAGSFLVPVGGILKVAKVAKATQKAKYAVMKKIDESETITKYLDSAGTPLTKQQQKSVQANILSGDGYIHRVGKTRNTMAIKQKIQGRVTRFKNRNKVIEFIDPQSVPPDVMGFNSILGNNVISLNPKNIRTPEQAIDTLSHESIHQAIMSGEKVSSTSATASLQYDNISYASRLFRAKTLDAMNVGPLKQSQKMYAHADAVVDDLSPKNMPGSTRGDIVQSRAHGITGFDYVSSVSKTPMNEATIARGDYDHFVRVENIKRNKKVKGLKRNEGPEYSEQLFNQKNMELDEAYKLRNTPKSSSPNDPNYLLTLYPEKPLKNKWRDEFIPFQKAELAKERAKELKLFNQSDQRKNIGLVSAMFVPITASTVSKVKAAVKGTGRRFNQDQSLGGYGQFL